jgi:hypothetical protein
MNDGSQETVWSSNWRVVCFGIAEVLPYDWVYAASYIRVSRMLSLPRTYLLLPLTGVCFHDGRSNAGTSSMGCGRSFRFLAAPGRSFPSGVEKCIT